MYTVAETRTPVPLGRNTWWGLSPCWYNTPLDVVYVVDQGVVPMLFLRSWTRTPRHPTKFTFARRGHTEIWITRCGDDFDLFDFAPSLGWGFTPNITLSLAGCWTGFSMHLLVLGGHYELQPFLTILWQRKINWRCAWTSVLEGCMKVVQK